MFMPVQRRSKSRQKPKTVLMRANASLQKLDRLYAFDFFVQFFVRGHEGAFEPPAELNISGVIEGYFVFPGQGQSALKFFQSEVEPFEGKIPQKRKCLCNGRFGKPRLRREYIADLIEQQVRHGHDFVPRDMSVLQTGRGDSAFLIIEYPLEDHRGVQDDHLRSRASRTAFTTSRRAVAF